MSRLDAVIDWEIFRPLLDAALEKPAKERQKEVDARWARKNDERHYGYKNHIKADAQSKLIEKYRVTDASVHDSQMLEALVQSAEGEVYADSAYRSTETEAMSASKNLASQIHERACRRRALSEEQNNATGGSQRCVCAHIEHVFGYMSQTMKGFYLRYIGKRRNAAAIGFINLIYNMARYEQITRLKLLPLRAV